MNYIRTPSRGRINASLNPLFPNAVDFLWAELQEASKVLPNFWAALKYTRGVEANTLYQAVWLAQEVRLKGITHCMLTLHGRNECLSSGGLLEPASLAANQETGLTLSVFPKLSNYTHRCETRRLYCGGYCVGWTGAREFSHHLQYLIGGLDGCSYREPSDKMGEIRLV